MVVAAVTATLGALGVGTFYLPFMADRDKIRGLHEEADVDPRAQREYQEIMKRSGILTIDGTVSSLLSFASIFMLPRRRCSRALTSITPAISTIKRICIANIYREGA